MGFYFPSTLQLQGVPSAGIDMDFECSIVFSLNPLDGNFVKWY